MPRRNGRTTAARIATVTSWLERRGYTVVFERGIESQIHPKEPKFPENKKTRREVWIDNAPSLECQLHTLLHEAGHYIVESRKNYLEKYSHGYPVVGTKKAKTVMHWVHLIGEEYEAWDEGLVLARRLHIPIRKVVYERHRCPALMSYMRKAVLEKDGAIPTAAEVRSQPVVELYWLDDMRPAPEGWIWIHDANEAIPLLELHAQTGQSGNTVWSFDHDLGDEKAFTGYDVARWIEERTHTDPTYDPPRMLIHTANPVGRENLRRCAESVKRAVLARKV